MAEEVQIKLEPPDFTENENEVVSQEPQRDNLDFVKVENGEEDDFIETPANLPAFKILDERPDIITVNAADLKTEDERIFIENITKKTFFKNRNNQSPYIYTCQKCRKTFNLRTIFVAHVNSGLCVGVAKEKSCYKCQLNFNTPEELEEHMEEHSTNRYKCSKNCGKSFESVTECHEHENQEHVLRHLKCNICNQKFSGLDALSKHMQTHRGLKRFICSYCREWFSSTWDMYEHWQSESNTCGKLAKKGRIHNIDSVLQEVAAGSAARENGKIDQMSKENDAFPISTGELQIKEEPLDTNDTEFSENGSFDVAAAAPFDPALLAHCDIKTEFDYDIEIKSEPVTDFPEEFNLSGVNDPNAVETPTPESDLSDLDTTHSGLPSKKIIFKSLTGFSALNLNAAIKTKSLADSPVPPLVPIQRRKVVYPPPPRNRRPVQQPHLQSQALKLQNFKIVKLAPNTRIIRLPTKCDTFPMTSTMSTASKVDGKAGQVEGKANCQTRQEQIQLNEIAYPYTCVDTFNPSLKTYPPWPAIKKDGEPFNVDEFKNALHKFIKIAKRNKRNICVPRDYLDTIDNLPEQRKIIDDMLEQIKAAETASQGWSANARDISKSSAALSDAGDESSMDQKNVSDSSGLINSENDNGSGTHNNDDSSQNSFITQNSTENMEADLVSDQSELPKSLYLPVKSSYDYELVVLRCNHPEYRFAWICPNCPLQYEQKYAFRGHLASSHNMSNEQLDELVVEVKAFAATVSLEMQAVKAKERNRVDREQQTEKSTLVPQKYTCSECGRACSSRVMLNDHVRGKCSRVPQYPCNVCGKRFYSGSTLNCHITIHTGELPHKCHYCDKRFRTRGQVNVHHRTHTGERPFVCQVCSQAFTHRETLISHLSRHIGMKRYKCYACNKHFSCISGLKTHRDIRPDTCGKVKFNSRAIGPRVRVIRGKVLFEPQPDINPYLRSEDPQEILSEIQNQQEQPQPEKQLQNVESPLA